MRIEPIRVEAPPLAGRAVAAQRWNSLTFLHWRADPETVAPLLPTGLRPDVYDGATWVGLIPFLLDRASILGSPPVPYAGRFVEVNVRLYAVDEVGRRGVVFLSLEASRLAAVIAARVVFGLPYFWSRTSMSRDGDVVSYRARRIGGSSPESAIRVRVGEPRDSTQLDDFLTARWGMFVERRGRLRFVPNEHEPWELRSARVLELRDDLVAASGLPGLVDRKPDSVLFADGVTTRFGRPA
jgi:uncharacterized protein YqjF (DUF2071 family)